MLFLLLAGGSQASQHCHLRQYANAESTERKHRTEASCFASQDAKVFV